jgi:hypothetical protein
MMIKLRAARLSGQRKGVTSVEIPVHPDSDPKTCTEWQTIDVPSEVVEHLQKRNRTHFGQAHGTPFTVPPLSSDLGFCGDTSGTDNILNGRYDASGLHANVKLLLTHLKHVEAIIQEPTFPTISEAEFIG